MANTRRKWQIRLKNLETKEISRSPFLSKRTEAQKWYEFFREAATYHFIWIVEEGSEKPTTAVRKPLRAS